MQDFCIKLQGVAVIACISKNLHKNNYNILFFLRALLSPFLFFTVLLVGFFGKKHKKVGHNDEKYGDVS